MSEEKKPPPGVPPKELRNRAEYVLLTCVLADMGVEPQGFRFACVMCRHKPTFSERKRLVTIMRGAKLSIHTALRNLAQC